MEAIGRLVNVVPIAAGRGISLKGAGGVTFVCTGADTFTLTSSATFGGTYATPGNILSYYYQAAATNGSAALTKVTQSASNAVVQGSANTTIISVNADSLPDGNVYVKCTASAAGLVTAVLHDLKPQQSAANLPIPSA